jgi:hypothetical protein
MQNLSLMPKSDALEANIPKKKAFCWYCGEEYWTYEPLRTEPPDSQTIAATIRKVSDIKPVDTCFKPECQRAEMMRQDALYSWLLRPVFEAKLSQKEK